MYHHLRGKLIELSSLNAVVETSGVGWDVHVPLSTSSLLGEGLGEEVLLYTHLLVREDVLKLFGFLSTEERALFRLLLSVSGTGPKIALQALKCCGGTHQSRHVLQRKSKLCSRSTLAATPWSY